MATLAQFRQLALAMPEAEEKSHFEQPDFRVRNKIFAGLSRDGTQGTLKLTPEIQSTLVGADSPFTPAAGAWGRSGWTSVKLAAVERGVLAELVAEAWRLIAPKTLVAAHERARAPEPASRAAKKKPRRRA